ncbi:MAG: cation:proton antiporter [Deltaproteobacteria bacterium]|nr:MAG: cation:proton antiporter [Deltaproteobacteria bacterium]
MAISLALIVVFGLAADILFRRLKLPGLVGMLIVGVLVGPYVLGLMRPEMMGVSADFRRIALIVILLRAGFELRRDTLHRVGRTALIMSAVPAIFEIAAVMAVAPYFLNLTLLEATILGSILGAVSPAVVVPLMIDFMERGKGAKKGIPTLILAASSVDDVFVIVLFTIFLGMYGGQKVNIAWQLAGIPVSVVLGVIVGLIPGYLLYRLFLKYDWQPPRRTLLVIGTSICLLWIEDVAHGIVPIASLLGVMAIGFIILEKEEAIAHLISQKLKKLWVFAELLLFVLVGAQVNVSVAWKAGAAGLLVIFIGLVARSIGTYLSVMGTDLNWKERLFCVVSYVPKATVQAAIGAVPLEAGVAGGEVILAVAVLSILVTAPLGAIGIMLMGEPILAEEKLAGYRFKALREKLQLPRVGERIRSKKYGTVWKIIEEKEIWLDLEETKAQEAQPTPAIYMRFWRPDTAAGPGTGKTMEYRYSFLDVSFHANWEILYD